MDVFPLLNGEFEDNVLLNESFNSEEYSSPKSFAKSVKAQTLLRQGLYIFKMLSILQLI